MAAVLHHCRSWVPVEATAAAPMQGGLPSAEWRKRLGPLVVVCGALRQLSQVQTSTHAMPLPSTSSSTAATAPAGVGGIVAAALQHNAITAAGSTPVPGPGSRWQEVLATPEVGQLRQLLRDAIVTLGYGPGAAPVSPEDEDCREVLLPMAGALAALTQHLPADEAVAAAPELLWVDVSRLLDSACVRKNLMSIANDRSYTRGMTICSFWPDLAQLVSGQQQLCPHSMLHSCSRAPACLPRAVQTAAPCRSSSRI